MKILTVTLNPAIDTRYNLENLSLGEINRIVSLNKTIGGKGLNVSRILDKLGSDVLATGLLGGYNGNFINDKIKETTIKNYFFQISGETRTCLAIIGESGLNTEVLEQGPIINKSEESQFIEKYNTLIKEVDLISISGSLPRGLDPEIYNKLINNAKKLRKKVILDTSGKTLKNSIKAKPYLIKPNIDEIQYLLGRKIKTEEDLVKAMRSLLEEGVENILVTLGKDGGYFLNQEKLYKLTIPKIKVKNTVGSGDSTIAGYLYGISKNYILEDTLKTALACGMSNASLSNTGDVKLDDINKFKELIKISEVV